MTECPLPTKSRKVSFPTMKCDWNKFVNLRQQGLSNFMGCEDVIAGKLYSRMDEYSLETEPDLGKQHGGIFNLEFSLDGRLLLAACENKSVLVHDTHNQKLVNVMQDAHQSGVYCVRFLNDRSFATCSNDKTIKLWDTRNLSEAYNILAGQSNWVKNIEYLEKDNIMVTSAFDGSIYVWHLNSGTENIFLHDEIFLKKVLIRTKLSPDGSKMVISTMRGYMIIVHDLNLHTLASDFRLFNPILYREMQISGHSFPSGTVCNHLFHPTNKRNRVEFIDDFTLDAEHITTLLIHPHGWNAVSRSSSKDELYEVTCVHDIQKRDLRENEDCYMYTEEVDGSYTQERQPQMYGGNEERVQLPTMGINNSGLIGRHNYTDYFRLRPEEKNKVVGNAQRLTNYAVEQNVGTEYIKELCYSKDGRIICSPFNRGVRLLGFSDNYEVWTNCVPDSPSPLKDLVVLEDYHPYFVVSCKFSPVDFTLVSGCLDGKIVWYKPIF